MSFEPKNQKSALDEIMEKIDAMQQDAQVIENTKQIIQEHGNPPQEEESTDNIIDSSLFDAIKNGKKTDANKSPLRRLIDGDEDDNDEDEQPARSILEDTDAEDIEEYESEEDRDEIYRDLKNTVGKMAVKSILFFLIALVTIYLFIAGFVPSLFAGQVDSVWFDIAFLAIDILCVALSSGIFLQGLSLLLRAKADTDTLLALLAVSLIAARIAGMIRPELLPPTLNFEPMLILGLYFNVVAKKKIASNIKKNFKKLSVSSDKLTVTVPASCETNNELILETGEGGEVMYAHKTGLVSGCIDHCYSDYDYDRKSYRLLFFSILLVVAATIVVFQLSGWKAGILFPAAALSISVPFFSRYFYAASIYKVGQKVRKNGGVLTSAASAKELEDADLMIVSEEDFLGNDAVLLQGVKAMGPMEIDQLITNIAALFKEVGTPLKPLFMKMIDQRSVSLPRVDDIYYHEGMGYSCLVHSKMLLVGNLELMQHFNIEFPQQLQGIQLKDCHFPVYVAYQKLPVGIFIVSYERDAQTEAAIRIAEDEQVGVGIVSNNFLFGSSLLKKLYPSTHPELFHFISPKTGAACRPFLKRQSKSADLIASTSRVKGLMASLYGASKLLTALKINSIIRAIYTVLALVLIFFIALAGYSDNTALQILAFQTIWMLPVCAICTFCK